MASIIKVDTIQDQDGNNIINENANTITIGKSGDTVQVAAGAEFVGGGTQWQSTIVTGTTLSAVAGNGYWIDTTSNACTVTLPASASVGDTIEFADYARTWQTNNVTVNPNSLNYQGNTSPNPTLSTQGQHLKIVYSGATQGWIPTNDDPVALGTPQPITADFLVVAGGASGGRGNVAGAGGGGAGGLRTSYGASSGGGSSNETSIGLTPGETYTITVGAGGSSAPDTSDGNNGNDSSLSGTGITTITSTGGGSGSWIVGGLDGNAGGCGGGATTNGPQGYGGSGTANQGFDGGDSFNSPGYTLGGGGGGTAQAGQSVSSTNYGGDGGDGLAVSITGSSVYYAGGGGGGIDDRGGNPNPGTNGSGGLGGGANALNNTGTANTGGGGSAGKDGGSSNAGGSGIVILRLPTADYTGTTTGSPTVTTDGTDTILTFNASGSYTA
jgi:hypothetical protein